MTKVNKECRQNETVDESLKWTSERERNRRESGNQWDRKKERKREEEKDKK